MGSAMIMQFPVAHNDELLVSILARFVARQGLKDDKVALEVLFGSRNIVPSPLLQGHIQALLSRVGHIWSIGQNELIQRHSILSIFQSFVEPSRIHEVKKRLIKSEKSDVMTGIGINASNIKWPRNYRYCPDCVIEDYKNLAYSYWRRLFQLPGVMVCPKHHCYLQNSPFKLRPERRHAFKDASFLVPQAQLTPLYVKPNDKLLLLATVIKQLLETKTPYVTPQQWTIFYQRCIADQGLIIRNRPDHFNIRKIVEYFWGKAFLDQQGLGLNIENSWLLAFFRKQRRHYSFLHHIVCHMALFPGYSILNSIQSASLITDYIRKKRIYTNVKAIERCDEYRASWLRICSNLLVLKDIRATTEGAKTYSWLYRFDNTWLQDHLPTRIRNDVGRQINWRKRDIDIVKTLIKIRNKSYDNLNLPRMTQTWFITQTNVSWGIVNHLNKLPLCRSFFVKYSESIDEYQIRRVLAIIASYINSHEPLPKLYEIERIAGLSKKRSRKAVKHILRMDFEKFSSVKLPSKRH
jgi:hypothetical protein